MGTRRCGAEEGEAGGGRRLCCFLDGEPLPSSSPRAAAGGGRRETRGPGGLPLRAVGCGGGYSRCAPVSPPPSNLLLPVLPTLTCKRRLHCKSPTLWNTLRHPQLPSALVSERVCVLSPPVSSPSLRRIPCSPDPAPFPSPGTQHTRHLLCPVLLLQPPLPLPFPQWSHLLKAPSRGSPPPPHFAQITIHPPL